MIEKNFNDNSKNTKESINVNIDCTLQALNLIGKSMESIMNLNLPSMLLAEWYIDTERLIRLRKN